MTDTNGPGRPRVGPTVKIALPGELIARLDAQAQVYGVARAEMVRRVLDESVPPIDPYDALAVEALRREGIAAWFGGMDIAMPLAVAALSAAMEQMGVEIPEDDAWVAPDGLAELAQRIAR